MSSQHFPELVRIARDVMPSLRYDMQNASTTFALQAACQKILDTMEMILHHIIITSANAMKAQAQVSAASPAPAPIPPRPQTMVPPPARIVPMPSPQHADIARSILADVAALPPPASTSQPQPIATFPSTPDLPVQPGVASVFITAQGTQAFSPSGVKTVLPPGEPVDLAATSGISPELPPAPPGVAQVILPPGGGMTAELAAALSARTGDAPTT